MILTQNVKVTKVKDHQASAGTAIDSDSVDMQGYEGVMFIGEMITAHASNFVNLATSSDDSTFNDLAGTKVTPGSNGDCGMIDLHKPLERYIRMEVDRGGANTAFGTIYAIQYGAGNRPPTHGATVVSGVHVSPAEGTA